MTTQQSKSSRARTKKATTSEPPVAEITIDGNMLKQLKQQILQEIKDEQTIKMEASKAERQRQRQEYEQYIERMKQSPEPWVDVTGWSEIDQGVKVELEWNDAFCDYLRSNGVTGTDDEQVVQRWVTLLLRDMADKMEEKDQTVSQFN